MMVPSRSRKTARRLAHSRSASVRAAPTAGKLSSGRVRGSSSTRPPPTRATTAGSPTRSRRASPSGRERRRRGPPAWSAGRRRGTSRRRPPTRPARAPGSGWRDRPPRAAPGAPLQLDGVEREHPEHRNGSRPPPPARGRARASPRVRRASSCRPEPLGRSDARGSAPPPTRARRCSPAWGPPSSLSPLKSTRSAPAASASATRGSPLSPQGERSASRPLPTSTRYGTPGLAAQRGERCRLGRRDEAALLEVGAMDGEHRGDAGVERLPIVVEVGAVGGADLAEPGAAPHQDVGNAERAADLDQLAAGDEDIPAGGERAQRQQQRARGVVHRQRVLGPGGRAQRLAAVVAPAAAGSGVEIELQVAVPRRDRRHRGRPPRAPAARGPGWCAARRRWR